MISARVRQSALIGSAGGNRVPNRDFVYQGLPAMHKSFFDAEAAR
jgi:hypothetical protein